MQPKSRIILWALALAWCAGGCGNILDGAGASARLLLGESCPWMDATAIDAVVRVVRTAGQDGAPRTAILGTLLRTCEQPILAVSRDQCGTCMLDIVAAAY